MPSNEGYKEVNMTKFKNFSNEMIIKDNSIDFKQAEKEKLTEVNMGSSRVSPWKENAAFDLDT